MEQLRTKNKRLREEKMGVLKLELEGLSVKKAKSQSPGTPLGGGAANAHLHESPIEQKAKLSEEGNILNRVYAKALEMGFSMDGFEMMRAEIVTPAGAKVGLPKSVNAEVFHEVDLRLPHQNPLLGTEGPLFDMRDDVLKVVDLDYFAHVLLIGSSGCGKTTTAFMVAKERYCIFLECWRQDGTSGKQNYHLDADEFIARRGEDQFDTVVRRTSRQVLARCALLAILHKTKKITPYEWLLLSISSNKKFADMTAHLLNVFDGTMANGEMILRAVATEIRQKPCLIVDEAHLLVEQEQKIVPNDKEPEKMVDTFGAMACSIVNFFRNDLAACVWIGTHMRLEELAALGPAVYKIENKCPVFAFCSFPWLTRDLFLEMARTILPGDHEMASLVLCGRARALASWIHHRIKDPKGDAGEAVASVVAASRLVDEIESVREQGLGGFGDSDLYDLWMAGVSYDQDGKCFCPERYGGTLAFTLKFKAGFFSEELNEDFTTGGKLELEPELRKPLVFEHRLDEPGLIDAIVKFFGPKAYESLQRHAGGKCANFKKNRQSEVSFWTLRYCARR